MAERGLDALTGTDALIRALRPSDDAGSVHAFKCSTVLFLPLPPAKEHGLEATVFEQRLLDYARASATDSSRRERFTPLRRIRADQESLLLFRQQKLVEEFVQVWVRQTKRAWRSSGVPVELPAVFSKARTQSFAML